VNYVDFKTHGATIKKKNTGTLFNDLNVTSAFLNHFYLIYSFVSEWNFIYSLSVAVWFIYQIVLLDVLNMTLFLFHAKKKNVQKKSVVLVSTLCKVWGYSSAVTENSGVLGWGMSWCWKNRTFGWHNSHSKFMELLAQQYRSTSQRLNLHILHLFDSTFATCKIIYIYIYTYIMYSHIRAYIPLEVDVSPHTGLVHCGNHPVI